MRVRMRSVILLAAAVGTVAAEAQAGNKGFADQDGGGPNDPRIEVSASIGPNVGAVFYPSDADAADVCGNYVQSGDAMVVAETPPSMPTDPAGANQAIRIRFPFALTKSKLKKSIWTPDAAYAPNSFLTFNVLVYDEFGLHVPVIATIGGVDVHGVKHSQDPSFPLWPDELGENRLVDDHSLVLIADDGDRSVSTISAFASTIGLPSGIRRIHVRIHEIGGITIDGHWVMDIGSGPVDAPVLLAVTPTKSKDGFVDGKQVVSKKTRFVLSFSEPVTPMSVGVGRKWVKQFDKLNGTDTMFHQNLGLFVHPGNGSPVWPNVRLIAEPLSGPPFDVPFDVYPTTSNALSSYRLVPKEKLPKGTVTLQVLSFASNANPDPGGGIVQSAVTSLYQTAFTDTGPDASRSFVVE